MRPWIVGWVLMSGSSSGSGHSSEYALLSLPPRARVRGGVAGGVRGVGAARVIGGGGEAARVTGGGGEVAGRGRGAGLREGAGTVNHWATLMLPSGLV